MKRILHCFNGLDNGGVEAFVMSVYRNIDRNKYQFDFLLRNENRTHYWDEIENMGGKIFVMPPYPKKAISNYIATKKFLEEHSEYDTVHVHANSLFYVSVLKIATKLNVKNVIIHSHSSCSQNKIVRIIHNHNKKKINRISNVQLACSNLAGKWMFNTSYKVIHNGIITDKFKYNEEIRNKLRDELNINDRFVIGHIGRFVEAKNHSFILDIFKNYSEKNPKATLVLVGFGPLKDTIVNKVCNLELSDKVIILTDRNDPYNLLQTFDLFLFPSLYEGLPISLVEAQCSGLPCLCSNEIDKRSFINPNVCSFGLNNSVEDWASKINELKSLDFDRANGKSLVKKSGFDIATTCNELIDIYNR